jgi:hypothetical protein
MMFSIFLASSNIYLLQMFLKALLSVQMYNCSLFVAEMMCSAAAAPFALKLLANIIGHLSLSFQQSSKIQALICSHFVPC